MTGKRGGGEGESDGAGGGGRMGIKERSARQREKGKGGGGGVKRRKRRREGKESAQRDPGCEGRRVREERACSPCPRLPGKRLGRRRRRRSGPRRARTAGGGGEAREGGARPGCGEGRLCHQRKEDWLHPKPVRMQTHGRASVAWSARGSRRGWELKGLTGVRET